MNELLKLALDQRKIKQVLNVIFVGSITSFCFERIFFKYSIIDLSDYKNIYSFFVSGHFIIPFALFYFIWILTIGIRILFFQVPNVFITKKFGSDITKFLIWYYTADATKYNSNVVLPKSKSLEWIIKSAPERATEDSELIKRALHSQKALESEYTLILRAFIAITIYFNSLEYFGWLTYLICISILFFMWLLQIVKYQFSEVAPYIIQYNQRQIEEKSSELTEK